MNGECQAFTEEVFRLHWTENILIGSDENLQRALVGLAKDLKLLVERAQSSEIKETLNKQTERAKSLGIFGAPSFTVGKELFWGDDRLEEALEWGRSL